MRPTTGLAVFGALVVGLVLFTIPASAQSPVLGDQWLDAVTYNELNRGFIVEDGVLPGSLDWRDLGMVTPVEEQGQCEHGVWAFAAVATVESKLLMLGQGQHDLSEQQLLSCHGGTASGCCIGDMRALQFYMNNGAMEESCTGFGDGETGCPGTSNVTCDDLDPCLPGIPVGLEFYTVITEAPQMDLAVTQMQASIYFHGPGYLRFDLYEDFDAYWVSGSTDAYAHQTGDLVGGYAALVIGWDDTKQAWLCKSSRGSGSGPLGNGLFWLGYDGHKNDLHIQMGNLRLPGGLKTHCASCVGALDQNHEVGVADKDAWYVDHKLAGQTTPTISSVDHGSVFAGPYTNFVFFSVKVDSDSIITPGGQLGGTVGDPGGEPIDLPGLIYGVPSEMWIEVPAEFTEVQSYLVWGGGAIEVRHYETCLAAAPEDTASED